MYHDLDECREDYAEYVDVFDTIEAEDSAFDAEDDAAFFEQLALDEEQYGEVEDMYANDWESAGFQPEYE